MDEIIYILAIIIGPSLAVLINISYNRRAMRTRWHTTGISGSFERRKDGAISSINLDFSLTNHGMKNISIKHAHLRIIRKGHVSIYPIFPENFTPVNLGAGKTKLMKLSFQIPDDSSLIYNDIESLKNGFILVELTLVDNDADQAKSRIIVYEGGVKKFIEKYGSPHPKTMGIMIDNVRNSAIVKN